MSDQPLPGDELVSAYLDNETTPAEADALEHDDALMARSATLSTVRDAVAEPVPPLPAHLRDQLIGAAMAAAEQDTPGSGGVVVPLRRTRQALLAAAAAVVVVAAVAGANLLSGRLGSDDHAGMATAAPMAAEAASSPDSADSDGAAAEEPAAEMEPAEAMMDEADMADDAMADEVAPAEESAAAVSAEEALAAAEAAEEARARPAEEAAAARDSDDDESSSEPGAESETSPVMLAVDLGVFDDIDSFFDLLEARLPDTSGNDEVLSAPGACSATVRDYVDAPSIEMLEFFVAVLDAPERTVIDAGLARLSDGTTIMVHAVEPDCTPQIYSPDGGATP